MHKRPSLSRQTALLDKGKARLLKSGEFLTADAFSVITHQCSAQTCVDLMAWKQAGYIFSLTHEVKEYFPIYAFDSTSGYRPFSPLAAIITTLAPSKHEWAMALWFGSSNSYLQGRMPKEAMLDSPAQVLDAARYEVYGVLHG